MCKNSEAQITQGLDVLLAAMTAAAGEQMKPAWNDAKDMYATIDSIREGSTTWRQAIFRYNGKLPKNPPHWMMEDYVLYYRDVEEVLHEQVGTPEFDGEFDYVPFQEFDGGGDRVWTNLMSGDWAYQKAVRIFYCYLTCLSMTIIRMKF